MKMKRRILAWILCVCMLAVHLPMTAFAEDVQQSESNQESQQSESEHESQKDELEPDNVCTECHQTDGVHTEECSMYQPQKMREVTCTCGIVTDVHTSGCPLYVAEPIIISEIYATVEIPLAGFASTAVVCSSNGIGYTITPSGEGKWQDPGGNEASCFINGYEYRALFNVITEEGYELSPEAVVYVNDSTECVSLVGGLPYPASQFDFVCYPVVYGDINYIELTNVPTPEIGEAALPYSYDNTEEHYKVTGTWQKYDAAAQSYIDMSASETFESGNNYRLHLVAETELGYIFFDNCFMYVNGEDVNMSHSEYVGDAFITTSFAEKIDKVEISADAIPKAVLGESFKDTIIKVPVKEGSHYTAYGYWVHEDLYNEEYEGTFEKGEVYYFVLKVVPNEGYALSDDLMFYVGDEEIWAYDGDPISAQHRIRTSFAEVITEIELIDLPAASAGGKLQMGYFDIKVPENAHYTAEAHWIVLGEDFWEDITEESVEKGNAYAIAVDIYPEAGYEFASDVIIKANGVEEKISHNSEDYIYYEREYSFREQISKVELIGLAEPVVGQTPTVAGLKTAEGVNYVIQNASWEDADTYELVSKFEEGHSYLLNISVISKKGYEYSEVVKAYLDGKNVNAYVSGNEIYISEIYSFKEVIPEIKISNLPQFKIGNAAEKDVTVPEGANYTAEAFWRVWDDAKEEYSEFDGVFESGKTYQMFVRVLPKAGYRFDRNQTVFYVDGKQSNHTNVSDYNGYYERDFSTEVKTITRIEVSIDEPTVGNHSSIQPKVSIIGNANYKVVYENWVPSWITGDVNDFYPYEGYFKAGQNYGVDVVFTANEGYVFAEDAVVIINGKVIPVEAITINSAKTFQVSYFFGMGTDESEFDESESNKGESNEGEIGTKPDSGQGTKPSVNAGESPATGDASDICMWMGMMLISVAVMTGCGWIWFTKKKN